MKDRFIGPSTANQIDALKRQDIVGGISKLAQAIADCGEVIEYQKGDELIVQGASDNDIYFLVAGSVGVMVKQNNIAVRRAGQTVGEMAAVEPSQPRSASVLATETTVAVKVSNADFMRLATQYPQMWKPLTQALSRRLFERNKLIETPNAAPKLFIISSAEALSVARELHSGLAHDVLGTVWTDGVFFAGSFTLEALLIAVDESDFAIAVAQPDDIVESRGTRMATLRDNVLFELGLFMGRLGRERTFLVHPKVKDLKLPTDLQGLTALSYEPCDPKDLPSRLGPVCNSVRKQVKLLGVRKQIQD